MPFTPFNAQGNNGTQPGVQPTNGFTPFNASSTAQDTNQSSDIQQAPHTFLGGIVRNVLTMPARAATNLVQAGEQIANKPLTEPFSGSYLGRVQPLGARKDATVQQGVSTANTADLFGQGAGAGLEAASYIVPVGEVGNIAKAGLSGLVKSAATQGLKAGAISGALAGAGQGLQNEKSAGEVATNALTGAIGGGLLGGTLGGSTAGISKAVNLARNGDIGAASNIMNRVARLTPSDANKFSDLAGMSHGEYLAKSGNFGTPEQILQKESQKFVNSLDQVDSAIAKLPGVYHSDPVTSALSELHARESVVSTPGAPSPDKSTIDALVKANNQGGLTMSQINQVKRIYERNIKLQYAKDITGQTSEKLARATNIDNAMRNWQFNQAEQLGLKNLPELNKQTQISKQLINSLGKQIVGKTGNNALSLTDWIMLSHGNPQAIAGFLTKKTLSSAPVRSGVAKLLAKSPTITEKTANLVPTAENTFRNVSPTGAKLLPSPAQGSPRVSISGSQPIPVLPSGINAEMTGKTGIIPAKQPNLLQTKK